MKLLTLGESPKKIADKIGIGSERDATYTSKSPPSQPGERSKYGGRPADIKKEE